MTKRGSGPPLRFLAEQRVEGRAGVVGGGLTPRLPVRSNVFAGA